MDERLKRLARFTNLNVACRSESEKSLLQRRWKIKICLLLWPENKSVSLHWKSPGYLTSNELYFSVLINSKNSFCISATFKINWLKGKWGCSQKTSLDHCNIGKYLPFINTTRFLTLHDVGKKNRFPNWVVSNFFKFCS